MIFKAIPTLKQSTILWYALIIQSPTHTFSYGRSYFYTLNEVFCNILLSLAHLETFVQNSEYLVFGNES